MIRLNWEEIALAILLSAIVGGSIVKGNWSTAGAAAIFVGLIVAAGARGAPHFPQENASE